MAIHEKNGTVIGNSHSKEERRQIAKGMGRDGPEILYLTLDGDDREREYRVTWYGHGECWRQDEAAFHDREMAIVQRKDGTEYLVCRVDDECPADYENSEWESVECCRGLESGIGWPKLTGEQFKKAL